MCTFITIKLFNKWFYVQNSEPNKCIIPICIKFNIISSLFCLGYQMKMLSNGLIIYIKHIIKQQVFKNKFAHEDTRK